MTTKPTYRLLILATLVICPVSAMSATSGEDMYMTSCATCHGDDGTGEMPGVADLSINTQWTQMSDEKLIVHLSKGISRPGAAMTMPPKGGNPDLSNADLTKIITFMRKNIIIAPR